MIKRYSVSALVTTLWGFDFDYEPFVTLDELVALYEVLETDKYEPLLKSIEKEHREVGVNNV